MCYFHGTKGLHGQGACKMYRSNSDAVTEQE